MRNFVTVVFMIVSLSIIGCASQSRVDTARVELLWPKAAPGQKNIFEGDMPTLTYYLPPKEAASGAAVVICPGGGYRDLAMNHEGHEVAKWLNSLGIAGFILRYRHNGDGYLHPAPLQDAQRAIRAVRSRAAEFNIDRNKIGIIGFSAGGHLASTAGTHFTENSYHPRDAVDEVSCRPDFMILLYASVSLLEKGRHGGSLRHILGENPAGELVRSLSNETQVTAETPPAFLVHCKDDPICPAEHSIDFCQALQKAGVEAEICLYEKGGHGFGLGRKNNPASSWPARCAVWLRTQKLCR